jgi:hypothetical protein
MRSKDLRIPSQALPLGGHTQTADFAMEDLSNISTMQLPFSVLIGKHGEGLVREYTSSEQQQSSML